MEAATMERTETEVEETETEEKVQEPSKPKMIFGEPAQKVISDVRNERDVLRNTRTIRGLVAGEFIELRAKAEADSRSAKDYKLTSKARALINELEADGQSFADDGDPEPESDDSE